MNTGKTYDNIKPTSLLSAIEIQDRVLKLYEKAIYENIGQALSLAKMNLFTLDLAKPAQLRRKINFSKKLISRAIQDLRQMTKQPGPGVILKKGFVFALEQEIDRIKHYQQIDTSFGFSGSFYRLEDERELEIYQLLQELILNLALQQETKLAVRVHFFPSRIDVNLVHPQEPANGEKMLADFAAMKDSLVCIGVTIKASQQNDQQDICISIKKKISGTI